MRRAHTLAQCALSKDSHEHCITHPLARARHTHRRNRTINRLRRNRQRVRKRNTPRRRACFRALRRARRTTSVLLGRATKHPHDRHKCQHHRQRFLHRLHAILSTRRRNLRIAHDPLRRFEWRRVSHRQRNLLITNPRSALREHAPQRDRRNLRRARHNLRNRRSIPQQHRTTGVNATTRQRQHTQLHAVGKLRRMAKSNDASPRVHRRHSASVSGAAACAAKDDRQAGPYPSETHRSSCAVMSG